MTAPDPDRVHPFERAGLGRAPFRFIGVHELRGPLRVTGPGGVEITVGAPGQPMGTCDYCATGIAYICTIESADGRRFGVGCDCVRKTTAAGVIVRTEAERAVRRLAAEKRRQIEQARIDAAACALARDEVRAALAGTKAPRGPGSTLDYVEWCMANAGHAGKLTAARIVERVSE